MLQYRKQPHERADVARQERSGLASETMQMAGQRVDEAVERLVRNRLTLVAATHQDGGARIRAHTVEKALDERRLAHPRSTVDMNGEGISFLRSTVRRHEGFELAQAPNEDGSGDHEIAGNVDHSRGGTELRQHRCCVGTIPRTPTEQSAAQGIEVGGYPDAVRRPWSIDRLLSQEHVDSRALERKPRGQGLVEHH